MTEDFGTHEGWDPKLAAPDQQKCPTCGRDRRSAECSCHQQGRSIDDFDWDEYYKTMAKKAGMTPETYKGLSKLLNRIPPPYQCGHEKEIENLKGHIRRLEKSNQELGEQL